MSFDYRKCKNALIEAAKAKQLHVYNALKEKHWIPNLNPSLIDDWDTLGTHLILNNWYDQYHEMYRPIIQERPSGMEPRRKQHVYASSVVGNDWTPTPINTTHNGYTVPGSRIMDSYACEDDMMHTMGLAVKSKNKDIIKEVYGWFQNRSAHWNTWDFDYAIETGDTSVLFQVIELWRNCPDGMRGVGIQMKLATIGKSRLDMLKLLDEFLPNKAYPDDMMRQINYSRGQSTRARRKMASYVSQKMLEVGHNQAEERRIERERIEQRQATAAPVAPPQERPTNLQKALSLIEDCEIQEGKYLEICNLLMDVHRRGVRV
jgi:hypothetical protein